MSGGTKTYDVVGEIEWLKKRIEALERASKQPQIPIWPGVQPEASKCPKCGLVMSSPMGYVCPMGGDCPTGLGGFTSMAGSTT
jgi:hypothetical protein